MPPGEQEHGRPPVLKSTSERPRSFLAQNAASEGTPEVEELEGKRRPTKWSMGVLNDTSTYEVPGSVLLLTGDHNQPLGLRDAPARISTSSLPAQSPNPSSRTSTTAPKNKTTLDGKIILTPQPEDSSNDPLNWPTWRRDAALLSLGIYCMVGGGMTPILAAGFTNVASTYDVTVPKVALTTGLYMMGMGVGSVFASPTAILYGKRPVYLFSAIVFIGTSVWCAASPSYNSLLVARIFQGFSVSPVECLPSATIAEIFFLHERAYRLGIYTLLLLGGKNLVPLVSAAIIQSLGWRWVFWIVAMVVGFCGILLFLFVPETFWDRSPVPKSRKTSRSTSKFSMFAGMRSTKTEKATATGLERQGDGVIDDPSLDNANTPARNLQRKRPPMALGPSTLRNLHVGFAQEDSINEKEARPADSIERPHNHHPGAMHEFKHFVEPAGGAPPTPALHNLDSPWYHDIERKGSDYVTTQNSSRARAATNMNVDGGTSAPQVLRSPQPGMIDEAVTFPPQSPAPAESQRYTTILREKPALTFVQQLKPYNGRLHQDNWFRVALRPFILFAYPAVLWSAVVYSCAVGWLIVLSESVAVIYRRRTTYGFSALSTGLIYLSPFIGGILGTAVAGKVSDIIVRAMAKRNGGLYEPEFRLVMAIPVALTTVIGLMGFGWSAEVHDAWIVPTIFFGVISFGCSLGSTTAITFCVDSYRQYAGEALVTLNFSKNIFHGLVFSLFFPGWLEHKGSKSVFIWLGVIQLVLMAFTVPMYIFGKRARMWTVRKNLMEKF
ncbi:related to HOL1 protein [Rhynchosporium graminicola]|uniref:Related to HOL1 protein n=1 Tax=Rhynchosporium graminicola TaxID=2792576 RepID=A0A1E1L4S3_9HELO|nr:related to HOL1 protein [Rhynchosporium commune]